MHNISALGIVLGRFIIFRLDNCIALHFNALQDEKYKLSKIPYFSG